MTFSSIFAWPALSQSNWMACGWLVYNAFFNKIDAPKLDVLEKRHVPGLLR